MTSEEALTALENIFNYCEEIDWHIPEDERSGYRMFPDIMALRRYIYEHEERIGDNNV